MNCWCTLWDLIRVKKTCDAVISSLFRHIERAPSIHLLREWPHVFCDMLSHIEAWNDEQLGKCAFWLCFWSKLANKDVSSNFSCTSILSWFLYVAQWGAYTNGSNICHCYHQIEARSQLWDSLSFLFKETKNLLFPSKKSCGAVIAGYKAVCFSSRCL